MSEDAKAGTAVGDADQSAPSAEKKKDQVHQNQKYTRHGNAELRGLTGREVEFQELGDLTALYDGLSTHTRQHVNPLTAEFQKPTPAPDWTGVFANPTLPLQVDVGCGSGRFVLIRAKRMRSDAGTPAAKTDHAETECLESPVPTGPARANVLGLEIRQKLVQRANEWAKRLNLTNCHFVFTNATVSWKSLLQSYPGPIELVSMQFPDPHFKKKHYKRRHVQPQLVKEMTETMPSGSRIFLQGDVPEVVRWMRDMFEMHSSGLFNLSDDCRDKPDLFREEWETPSHEAAVRDDSPDEDPVEDEASTSTVVANVGGDASTNDQSRVRSRKRVRVGTDGKCAPGSCGSLLWSADQTAGWLPENPLKVPTEREVYVAQIQAPVYRVMLLRV